MAAASGHVISANLPAIASSPSSTRVARPASRVRCGVATSESRRPYWAAAEEEIGVHLAASIPTSPPPNVLAPMLRLVSSAPRTMAPVLCVAACELVGGRRDSALGAACALHLVHSAFHAHRSLLDCADVAPGDGVKLLTADGLLSLGYQLVAESDAGGEPGRVLQVLVEIADATGAQGMAEGLHEEARRRQSGEGSGGTAEGEEYWLERVCGKKEGVLYACAAACGAILGGAGAEETESLRRCGRYVGMLHGFLYGGGAEVFAEATRGRTAAVASELRSLALSELEVLKGDKKDAIVGLVDVSL